MSLSRMQFCIHLGSIESLSDTAAFPGPISLPIATLGAEFYFDRVGTLNKDRFWDLDSRNVLPDDHIRLVTLTIAGFLGKDFLE